MGAGIRLGTIGGVEVLLDWSLLIIFMLITVGLGSGLFAQWHPDWGPAVTWITAMAAAVTFIVSVLVHELSHAWVGRARGVEIRRITLFVFGGMAQMEGEPRRWQDEFWMAIVGPLTSALIGVVSIVAGSLLAGDVRLEPGNLEAAIAALGPVPTLLFWLGPVNLVLALFNLVPGFPLDGGRVLRAGLWGLFGDLRRATRWAAAAGRAFAAILILAGFAMMLGFTIPAFGTGLVGGLWLALIGWFLNNAAIASVRQQQWHAALADVPVRRVMRTDVTTVGPDVSVSELVDGYLMTSGQRSFPVLDGRRFVGSIGIDDVRSVPRERWGTMAVADVMQPAAKLATLAPDDAALVAMSALNRQGGSEIPVVTPGNRELVGLLTHDNMLKWLEVVGGRREPVAWEEKGPGLGQQAGS